MFDDATSKLGKTAQIQRGDASTARKQSCYASVAAKEKLNVIFEQGEVDDSFYMFTGGPTWEGAGDCAASANITPETATGSGLRLGMTSAQVIARVGKPALHSANEIRYWALVEETTDTKTLEKARRRNPKLSDADIQAQYGHYSLSEQIRLNFTHDRLTYLATTKVARN